MMAGLAEATEKVKIWATVHANIHSPAIAAKMFVTLDQISNGRAGMNIVSGSYADEFEQMGLWDADDVEGGPLPDGRGLDPRRRPGSGPRTP